MCGLVCGITWDRVTARGLLRRWGTLFSQSLNSVVLWRKGMAAPLGICFESSCDKRRNMCRLTPVVKRIKGSWPRTCWVSADIFRRITERRWRTMVCCVCWEEAPKQTHIDLGREGMLKLNIRKNGVLLIRAVSEVTWGNFQGKPEAASSKELLNQWWATKCYEIKSSSSQTNHVASIIGQVTNSHQQMSPLLIFPWKIFLTFLDTVCRYTKEGS